MQSWFGKKIIFPFLLTLLFAGGVVQTSFHFHDAAHAGHSDSCQTCFFHHHIQTGSPDAAAPSVQSIPSVETRLPVLEASVVCSVLARWMPARAPPSA